MTSKLERFIPPNFNRSLFYSALNPEQLECVNCDVDTYIDDSCLEMTELAQDSSFSNEPELDGGPDTKKDLGILEHETYAPSMTCTEEQAARYIELTNNSNKDVELEIPTFIKSNPGFKFGKKVE